MVIGRLSIVTIVMRRRDKLDNLASCKSYLQVRHWVMVHLQGYLQKSFVFDDEHLKNPLGLGVFELLVTNFSEYQEAVQ